MVCRRALPWEATGADGAVEGVAGTADPAAIAAAGSGSGEGIPGRVTIVAREGPAAAATFGTGDGAPVGASSFSRRAAF